MNTPRFIDEMIAVVNQPDAPNVAALRSEYDAIDNVLDSYVQEELDGKLTHNQVLKYTEAKQQRREEIAAQLAQAGLRSPLQVLRDKTRGEPVDVIWSDLTLAEQRAIVAATLVVTILPADRGFKTFQADKIDIRLTDAADKAMRAATLHGHGQLSATRCVKGELT